MEPLNPKKYPILRSNPAASDDWWVHFQALLDDQTQWPSQYLFKFIVPKRGLEALQAIFGDHPVTVRASARGNYLSLTARMEMQSSDEVIAVYTAAGQVEGVISL